MTNFAERRSNLSITYESTDYTETYIFNRIVLVIIPTINEGKSEQWGNDTLFNSESYFNMVRREYFGEPLCMSLEID